MYSWNIRKSKLNNEIKLYLAGLKHIIGDKNREITDEFAARGTGRGNLMPTALANAAFKGWSNGIIDIYGKVSCSVYIRGRDANWIKQQVKEFVESELNPYMITPNDFIRQLHTEVEISLLESDNKFRSAYKNDRKDKFRTYFPVLLGVFGSFISAIFGSIIGVLGSDYIKAALLLFQNK
jgi:hypothetical protein